MSIDVTPCLCRQVCLVGELSRSRLVDVWSTTNPQSKKHCANIVFYNVVACNSIRHVVLGHSFRGPVPGGGTASSISTTSRTCGAGRTHDGFCPLFLVFYNVVPCRGTGRGLSSAAQRVKTFNTTGACLCGPSGGEYCHITYDAVAFSRPPQRRRRRIPWSGPISHPGSLSPSLSSRLRFCAVPLHLQQLGEPRPTGRRRAAVAPFEYSNIRILKLPFIRNDALSAINRIAANGKCKFLSKFLVTDNILCQV